MSNSSKRDFSFDLLETEDESVILKNKAGGKTTLHINQDIDSWALKAIIEKNGESIAVIENHRGENGPILYLTTKGTIASFSKSFEPTSAPEESCYLGRALKAVLESDDDILGKEILSREDDPSYEAIAPCLPPMQRMQIPRPYGAEGHRNGLQHKSSISFVGTRNCIDKPVILEGVYTGKNNLYPGKFTKDFVLPNAVPEIRHLSADEKIYEGIVGGWLPVLRYRFEKWEIIAFANPNPPTMWIQPVWFRVARINEGHVEDVHYFDTYAPYIPNVEPDPKKFYTKLLETSEDWQSVFESAMEIDVPEERIANFCKHSIMREMITRIGDWPKYGVFHQEYNGPEYDGFQDTFNSSVSVMLEWGFLDTAKRYIDNYFSYFVKDNGSITFRGPEIAQYGRHLTMLAQYYNYTKDHVNIRWSLYDLRRFSRAYFENLFLADI